MSKSNLGDEVGPAQVDVEEAGFFVRSVNFERGTVALSDQTEAPLALSTLRLSPLDEAWICTVKTELVDGGLPARFMHAAQSEVLNAVEEQGDALGVRLAGAWCALPEL